jgi:hypothetical protein
MALIIKRDPTYAESNITVVGITNRAYGRPQFILVNSDEGKTPSLKFVGSRFRAPETSSQTLEDMARIRFTEQTGLKIDKMLGLRTIIPTRSRHMDQWMFRNVFLGVVNDVTQDKNDGREVYIANPGQGCFPIVESVHVLGNSKKTVPLEWVKEDNMVLARVTKDILNNFNWKDYSTDWYRKIPCVGVEAQTTSDYRPLGCGLAVASMILLYQENPHEPMKVILLKRKGDKYPGYAGGKIETLISHESENIDPISCCAQEGSQEFGFEVQPRALVSVAATALEVPEGTKQEEFRYYNSLVDYFFVAEPTNPHKVQEALKDPSRFLEGKMECYIVEDLDEHRDRVLRRELRMPDMIPNGEQFYSTSPGNKIPLTHIRASGNY